MKLERLQSETIDVMRLPLMILVVYVHMFPKTQPFSLLEYNNVIWTLYNIIGISLSHCIGQLAVPCFFVFSGYLYFRNTDTFTWGGYKYKLKSRIVHLMIPYVIWNVLQIILQLVLACHKVGDYSIDVLITSFYDLGGFHTFYDSNVWSVTTMNWLGMPAPMSGPILLPLWFLRDLIILSLLAPGIFFFIKKTNKWGMLLLLLLQLSGIWMSSNLLNSVSLFFFSVGVYLAINKMNIIQTCRLYFRMTWPLLLIVFILCIYFDANRTPEGQIIFPFFRILGLFGLISLFAYLVEYKYLKPNTLLSKASYFLYLSHFSVFLFIAKAALGYEVCCNSYIQIFLYIIIPFVTTGMALVVYYVVSKYFPLLCFILTGSK